MAWLVPENRRFERAHVIGQKIEGPEERHARVVHQLEAGDERDIISDGQRVLRNFFTGKPTKNIKLVSTVFRVQKSVFG